MGQCVSRKAAGAFAASAATAHNRPTKMQKHKKLEVREWQYSFSVIYCERRNWIRVRVGTVESFIKVDKGKKDNNKLYYYV